MFEIVTVIARNDIFTLGTHRSIDLDRTNVTDLTFFSGDLFFVVETAHDALGRVESAVFTCFLFHMCGLDMGRF